MPALALRFAAPDLDTLERTLIEPLPLDLRGGEIREQFFRDVYFDTPDQVLRARGAVCRFRISADDRRWLTLMFHRGGKGGLQDSAIEADVGEQDASMALSGTSAPARRLQALTDPARLVPRLELEIHRRVRPARRRLLPFVRTELIADAITVRSNDLAHVIYELTVRPITRRLLSLDTIATALRERFGLRGLIDDRLTRAERVLETLEAGKLAEAVQQDREVTVLVVDQGRIALARKEAEFRLPVRTGGGEETCRDLLRTVLGSPEGRLAQLGLVRPTGTRPTMEVWVARRVRKAPRSDLGQQLEWFVPAEVVARAGSPVLRDPRTLAALTVAARSGDLPEWAASPEATGNSTSAQEVSEQRRSFAAMAAVALPKGARKAAHAPPEHFFNVHLTWLEFNARVLALAEDPSTPLMARLRFLAIFSTNLDEFFMIRVGGLKRALAMGKTRQSLDGLSPEEQLNAIAVRVQALLDRQRRCFEEIRRRDLPRVGISIKSWSDLTPGERDELADYFDVELLPLLTPKAITLAPGHPFPKIQSLFLSLAVMVREPRGGTAHYVEVSLPDHVPQLVRIGTSRTFVPLEEVVAANIGELLPNRVVESAYPFRITRMGDLELDESAAADLAQAIQEEINRRGRAPAVRIELDRRMPAVIRERLQQELRSEDTGSRRLTGEADVYEADGLLNLGALMHISDSDIAPELDYRSFTPTHPIEAERSIFDVLDVRDVLVHHPYDSFETTFERLLGDAADDPDVIAIKLTLYRPGRPSVISDAIQRAAAGGKEVTVFVELKARFDEQQNIIWARQLERAGVHLVTGLVRYKTHAKIALVVRRKDGKVRRYAHIGTGNYNRKTARMYTDLGLLTSDAVIGADLQKLFNELTGSSKPPNTEFKRLLVAPTNMLARMMEMIEREIAHAQAGRPARIRMKMNALVDAEIITALYRASQAGVDVDIVVRGICALRPGVPGLSERIRVISILGRFLEHGRIYCFENDASPEYYIGSADLRPRNLRHRVEVITPVTDPEARQRLEQILVTEIEDPTAWFLNSDGSYERGTPPTGVEAVSAQESFLEGRVDE